MLVAREEPARALDRQQTADAVQEYFARRPLTGRRILVIVPDNSRSGPVGEVFQLIFGCVGGTAEALDVLVALGTHPPLTGAQICKRLAVSAVERKTTYASVRFFNHRWDDDETFTSVGTISAAEIHAITGGLFSEDVNIEINKLIYNYDELFIVGPVFPHEVVGFSGGHKYIFPGIAGSDIINFFHWLGAVITNPRVNGEKDTPPRRVVERAASLVRVPRALFALVALENELKGLYIGDVTPAWEKAADLSSQVHIIYKARPFHTVLGIAPRLYDDLWTAGKVMYKLEPVVADGGTLIIYAPHINEISYTYGAVLDRIGYHTRDYFLKQMARFQGLPRGVMAHSTHVKGIGTFIDGVEKPRINVVLATGISAERCRRVNLGYLDPRKVDIAAHEDREEEGVLIVRHAGELLYRLSDGTIPQIA
ncbi:MAG: lactate racemase domain-containing protein [Phycisphaerae bacterium]